MKVNYPLNKITQVLDEKSITAAHKNSFNVDVEAQGYSDSGVSDVVEYPGVAPKNTGGVFTKALFDEYKIRAVQAAQTIETSDKKLTGLKAIFYPSGRIKFIVRKSIRGKNIYVAVGGYPEISIKDAREHAFKIIQELKTAVEAYGERFLTHSKMTFNELVDEYEKSVLSTGVKRSANTDLSKIRKYLRPLLGDKKLAGMTEADILSYLYALDLKPATRNRHLALIKAVFTWAIRMGYTNRSPALYIKALPEVTSDRRAMDDSQLQCWMEVCECWRNGKPDHEALALLMFLALTGLRLGETRHLRLEDVDWSRKVITLRHTKNGKLRRVPVCDKAFVLLTEQRQHLGDEGWVFPDKGTDNPVAEPRRLQKRLCEAAGIPPFTIHEMRHTFATKLIESGADIHTVKDLLGHSTIKVTSLYLHSSPARYHEAVNRAMADLNLVNMT
ncbi:tyrosine-type recombinase/integrase [Escherichia coli]|uniref:tyrosine-type recombinase/integrase n=1 Tax=Escherichia coli TaxID=562 RepID=UPI001F3BBDD2|nr:tyrosine-type recombinase/integrase [Escherichia coli]MCE4277519.1 tyrosine-type recombinase/integrase [Escherichia coli]MCE4581250.1 tyrosine-type recombinase/integrase [Escherichia coli]